MTWRAVAVILAISCALPPVRGTGLVVVESAAPEQANSSGPANATAKVEFHVEDVSPRQLAAMTSPGTKNVLLALYSPNLPKWQNFSSTLSQLAEHFSSNTSNFKVVKANCRDHPVFVKKFALRKFPTLLLYPAGVSGGLFLPVAFHVNRTFEDYRAEMTTIAEVTYSVTHDVDGLHPHVVSFLEIQDETDRTIAWTTGEQRREARRFRMENLRRKMMGLPLLTPTPVPTANATAEDSVNASVSVNVSASASASPSSVQASQSDPSVVADVTVGPDGSLMGSSSESAADSVSPTPVPTKDIGTIRAEEDKAMIAPLVEWAQESLKRHRIKAAKVEFYIELLERVARQGSQVLAQMLGARTSELFKDSEFLPPERREQLLMEINVLKPFVDAFFEE